MLSSNHMVRTSGCPYQYLQCRNSFDVVRVMFDFECQMLKCVKVQNSKYKKLYRVKSSKW